MRSLWQNSLKCMGSLELTVHMWSTLKTRGSNSIHVKESKEIPHNYAELIVQRQACETDNKMKSEPLYIIVAHPPLSLWVGSPWLPKLILASIYVVFWITRCSTKRFFLLILRKGRSSPKPPLRISENIILIIHWNILCMRLLFDTNPGRAFIQWVVLTLAFCRILTNWLYTCIWHRRLSLPYCRNYSFTISHCRHTISQPGNYQMV